jgi:hypothetical protein
MKHSTKNLVMALIVMCLPVPGAYSQTQMASLRPGQALLWHRTSPSPEKLDGPVLYQLLINASATPGSVPVFDTNPRHLINSPITVTGGNVFIGREGGVTIDGKTGVITFASGQTFPGVTGVNSVTSADNFIAIGGTATDPTVGLNTANTDARYLPLTGGTMTGNITFAAGQTFPSSALPNLAGEVTGPLGATVVSSTSFGNVPNTIVRRDGSGNFSTGTISLTGNLAFTNIASPSPGLITVAGLPFLHKFGIGNTFLGLSAGNFTMTGEENTVVGGGALSSNTTGEDNSAFGTLALSSNTTGSANSAFGFDALHSTTTGGSNAAFGEAALYSNTTGTGNSAFGDSALFFSTTGSFNAAFGASALYNNTAGVNNSAFGVGALGVNTTGSDNLALGSGALGNLVGGSENIALGEGAGLSLNGGENHDIYIANPGTAGESGTIRIGEAGFQTVTFIAGISGATSASGVNVFVNSAGQLGTATSSRRFKQDIADLGAESDILMKLRPVAFYYKSELDSTHTRQYGLVAEEVAQVAPGLVVLDQDGKPQTVRYHFVNAMLLNEVQKQRRLIEAQEKQLADQQEQIAALQQQMKGLMLRLTAMAKPGPRSNTPEVATLAK